MSHAAAPISVTWPSATPAAPTRRACEAASRFGLLIDDHLAPQGRGDLPFRLDARPGTVTLLTGPSGAGKSTLLRQAERALIDRNVRTLRLEDVRLRERPAVDLVRGRVDRALRTLARVGLGQADCFLRRPSELSDGQRWRLRLALAIDALRDDPGGALIVDECCATLDPGSTTAACATLRRAAREHSLRVLCASADPALVDALRPDEIVRAAAPGRWTSEAVSDNRETSPPVVIERGTMRDYGALGSTHYRAARPARPSLVLVARLTNHPGDHPLVGALVVSFPTLNSPVREVAWPGRYTSSDRASNARLVNEELRSLSRVVVDPRYRGLGIAVSLVRAYLASPQTMRTEGVGVMPGVSEFLAAAGMTRHDLPIRRADARLLDALAHAGVEEWRLAQGRAALGRAIAGSSATFIERELRAWARDGRAHRRYANAPLDELFLRACRFAACRPVGYTHDAA